MMGRGGYTTIHDVTTSQETKTAQPEAQSNSNIDALMFFGWLGCITGLSGASILAMNFTWSKWGWVGLVLSNIFMLMYTMVETNMLREKASVSWLMSPLMVMQFGYMALNSLGVYNWFFR